MKLEALINTMNEIYEELGDREVVLVVKTDGGDTVVLIEGIGLSEDGMIELRGKRCVSCADLLANANSRAGHMDRACGWPSEPGPYDIER